MKLDVLNSQTAGEPWYADGLAFTCTQCGNCCTGPPGFVWISVEEIKRLGEFLSMTPEQVVERYCRKISGRFSLKEGRDPRHGGYDCVFLQNGPPENERTRPAGMLDLSRASAAMPHLALLAGVLQSAAVWEQTSRRCPGMNNGKSYDRKSIEAIRDSKDWPSNSPESDSD